MTALAKARPYKAKLAPRDRNFPVAAATVCWQGGMVALTNAGANSVAKPAVVDATLKIVGVASSTADNRLGGAGAARVDVERGVFLMNNSATDPVTLGDLLKNVYAEDDNTVSRTGAVVSGNPTQAVAGTVYDIDPSGGVWVEFK